MLSYKINVSVPSISIQRVMGLTRVLLIVLLKKIAELAQDIQPVYCKVELDIAR